MTIPPRCYVQILDPVQRDEDSGNIVKDENGTILLQYGETEIRLHDDYKEPFPLYPGESIANKLEELPVLEANQAFHIKVCSELPPSLLRTCYSRVLIQRYTTRPFAILPTLMASKGQLETSGCLKALPHTSHASKKRF